MDPSAANLSLPPLPGEIWAVNNDANFDGESKPRYLIIIREPQPFAPQLVVAMVLSTETRYVSNVNILIPPDRSGLEIELLAQTKNVGEIAIEYLHHRVGNRLSRQIYDLLLTASNLERELAIDRQAWQSPGSSNHHTLNPVSRADLVGGACQNDNRFALHERAWLLSLHPDKIAKVSALVTNAIESRYEPIDLSQWWQHLFPSDWQELETLELPRKIATRRANISNSIEKIITDLKSSNDERITRQLIHQLTLKLKKSDRNNTLITTEIERLAIEIIDRTDDDELFWSAIDCLQTIDRSHPRLGIGRCKSIEIIGGINLSIQIAEKKDSSIALSVRILPRLSEAYLPDNLQLIISDEHNIVLQQITAKPGDYALQLKFSGEVGERFNICLKLDNLQSIYRFVI